MQKFHLNLITSEKSTLKSAGNCQWQSQDISISFVFLISLFEVLQFFFFIQMQNIIICASVCDFFFFFYFQKSDKKHDVVWSSWHKRAAAENLQELRTKSSTWGNFYSWVEWRFLLLRYVVKNSVFLLKPFKVLVSA